ncbi:protein PIGBOS1 [Phyllobates terribilis]|uniref:protein PIGBOS1 n=1 Tax=Phyllobates terribilis TaxID=111132 RepID=UPI003CCAC2CC
MMRGLPFGQLFLAVLLGFTGGVYIYKPLIQQYMSERKALESDMTTTDAVKKENE